MFFFDIDDTLYDLSDPFRRTCRYYYGDRMEPFMDELFLAFRRHGEVSFMAVENGRMTMREMYCYRLQKAFGEYGIEMDDEEALRFQKTYQKHQYRITLSEEMKAFLDEYGKRVSFGILSNGPAEHQREKVRSLGLTKWIKEEDIIISGEVGVTKPDTGIFRIAEKRAQGKEKWMIGDSFESDIVGACQAGWHSLWINRRRRTASDERNVPDHVAYSEQEMIEILKEIIKG